MAERKGFEPLKGFDSFNGLANRRLQPLGHLSGLEKSRLIKEYSQTSRLVEPIHKLLAKSKKHRPDKRTIFYLILDGDFCPAIFQLR
jgi:hypothetical protein